MVTSAWNDMNHTFFEDHKEHHKTEARDEEARAMHSCFVIRSLVD